MLTHLTLTGYRGFRSHSVKFRQSTIAVGANNAGKSTIVEALRVIATAASRFKTTNYTDPPEWANIPARLRGIRYSLDGLDFSFQNVCHDYGDPPAKVEAKFSSGLRIEVHITPDDQTVFSVYHDGDGNIINSRGLAKQNEDVQLIVMPTIGPLLEKEKIIGEDRTKSYLNSRLAPRHFRNQLYHLSEYFEEFVRLSQETWPGLRVEDLVVQDGELSLLVRDGRFVSEVAWMGHGLQTWLQTIWFLARTPSEGTIIIDEPDVYLHADMQRKVSRIVSERFRQKIIATHSLEIMSEYDPQSILIIDKRKRSSKYATSAPVVQNIADNLGSVHNINLSRLWMARRCIIVEGNDVDFLTVFHSKLYPNAESSLKAIPSLSVGGSGNWETALGIGVGLRQFGDQAITVYCIFDPDYRTEREIQDIENRGRAEGVNLRFWKRKEIENYLIDPNLIVRTISSRLIPTAVVTDPDQVARAIDREFARGREKLIEAIAYEIRKRRPRQKPETNLMQAENIVMKRGEDFEARIGTIGGKQMISRLSQWSQQKFQVSFGAMTLAREIYVDEMAGEMVEVLRSIENYERFPD